MITMDRIAHWRRLSDCDALAGAHLGDALKEACDALERVEKLCRDLEAGAGAMRVDVPHWVISVRSALHAPESNAPAPSPATAATETSGGAGEAQEGAACVCEKPIPVYDGPSDPAEDCPQHGNPVVVAHIRNLSGGDR